MQRPNGWAQAFDKVQQALASIAAHASAAPPGPHEPERVADLHCLKQEAFVCGVGLEDYSVPDVVAGVDIRALRIPRIGWLLVTNVRG